MQQDELFTTTSLLPGFLYEPEFIDRAEEAELVRLIQSLPLEEARYREFTARRRIVSFGASYDFSSRELRVAGAIPAGAASAAREDGQADGRAVRVDQARPGRRVPAGRAARVAP